MELFRLPRILVVQLKRFSYNSYVDEFLSFFHSRYERSLQCSIYICVCVCSFLFSPLTIIIIIFISALSLCFPSVIVLFLSSLPCTLPLYTNPSLPPSLILFSHLRFYRDKISAFVDFPITSFFVGKYLKNPTDQVYDLFAVSHHMGGLGGGHCKYSSACLSLDSVIFQ